MQLELHIRGNIAEPLRRYAERRFHFALRRFSHRVRRLRIYVADVNGPRGGVDKQCRVLLEVAPSGSLMLEETDVRLHEAMDRAAGRLRRCVRRELKRQQARRLGKVHGGSIRYPWTTKFTEARA
ncbi:MAG TPA: HPF/RaiA family ribosome-associated protein [Terriglobia bacterium]|nr:HPF/RaiA family ribosome-associated protein [Terriglobia bacterium]